SNHPDVSAFEKAMNLVLRLEGGLGNNSRDSGGITKYGISLRFLKSVDASATVNDIVDLERVVAIGLYCRHFWDACRCDELPASLAAILFDCAVNQGPTTAVKLLQSELGTKRDGLVGEETLTAVQQHRSIDLLAGFAARRAMRYAKHPEFAHFGRGWM
ncbi:MAG: glycoside hydrolase family 108 protein, partial [Gammaproteobacteria bacterium]